jgi:Pin2-interacting protein X1
LLQDKATTGKKGLGTGDRTQKVGGAHFKGQKKVFGDDDDDGSDGSKPEKEPGTGNGCSKDLLKEDDKPKKRKRDRDGGNEGTVQEGSKIKLKELISQILTQVLYLFPYVFSLLCYFFNFGALSGHISWRTQGLSTKEIILSDE